jgi:ABC-type sugar transport system ATPase subunit
MLAMHHAQEQRPGQVIVLDEPTATLAPADAAAVYQVATAAAQAGATIILITHHLEEVIAVAARVVVLRAGRLVSSSEVRGLNSRDLARMMLGDNDWKEPAEGRQAPAAPVQPLAMSLSGVTIPPLLEAQFDLRQGEILGIAGLRGAGPALLADILSGRTTPTTGRLVVHGHGIKFGHAGRLVHAGVVHVPEDRRNRGVHLGFSINDNLALVRFIRDRTTAILPLSSGQIRRHALD